jgi:hypothetical protein
MVNEGWASPWCAVSFPEGPVIALRAAAGDDDAEYDALFRLALKGALDEAGQARFVALSEQREAQRVSEAGAVRFRQLHGGLTEGEVVALSDRRS